MSLIQSSSEEALKQNIATEISAGKDPKQASAIAYETQRANDEYVPMAVPCIPESVTPATLNEQNRKYWASAGGEQTGGK